MFHFPSEMCITHLFYFVVPPVTPANSTVEVIVGDRFTLVVTITGFNLPITSITWRLGDMELTRATETVTVTTSSDLTQPPATSTLVVDPVLSLVSQGTYTVTVVNPAGTAVTGINVTVLGKLQFALFRKQMTGAYRHSLFQYIINFCRPGLISASLCNQVNPPIQSVVMSC